jgi:predicted ATPase
MLTELRFENFKSWKDTGVMRMAPLTGFFGTNSSGKTAILQFLLMLKQTVESNDQSQVLNFGNENTYVDLGSVSNLAHKHLLPTFLCWDLAFQPNPNGEEYFQVPVATGSFQWNDDDPSDSQSSEASRFYNPVAGELKTLQFCADVELSEDGINLKSFNYSYGGEDSENLIGLEQHGVDYVAETEGIFNLLLRGIDTSYVPMKHYIFADHRFLPYASVLTRAYVSELNEIYYLGTIRDHPKRFYSWSGEKPQDVGRRGENTIAALLTARKQDPEIEIKIAHWLKVMGLIDDFKVDLIAPEQRLYQASVRIAPGGTYCPITDVGFGVSQILPVLVLCYYVPKGSTIIFEQPEIHLHPSAQQKLADVFIDVIKHRELQIIIESHSEHLLHRLQRRIAEEELAPEQAALYFCQMENDGASSLTSLELDEFGNITNWPEDFFGNEMEDLVAMTEAAMQRSMDTEAA